jgi:hypothetical protein
MCPTMLVVLHRVVPFCYIPMESPSAMMLHGGNASCTSTALESSNTTTELPTTTNDVALENITVTDTATDSLTSSSACICSSTLLSMVQQACCQYGILCVRIVVGYNRRYTYMYDIIAFSMVLFNATEYDD